MLGRLAFNKGHHRKKIKSIPMRAGVVGCSDSGNAVGLDGDGATNPLKKLPNPKELTKLKNIFNQAINFFISSLVIKAL